jgi:outer membrane protein OmpA-like peptidoglycan-associated protein
MKRTVPLLLIAASLGFALPTLQGTRGTDFVSSARCENMGYLWFYMASEGYKDHVIFQDSAGVVQNTYDNWAAKPVVSLGFTPWHYLEFSAYGSGYFYYNVDNSAMTYGLTDVGGHVKGSIPFTPLDNPFVIATGIDGFFLMSIPFEFDATANQTMSQYLGYYPFEEAGPEFGGRLLFSLESQYISAHLNGGYWYRSVHNFGPDSTVSYPQTIIGGFAIESSPLKWFNLFAEFNLNYGLPMGSPEASLTGISTHASAGLRLPVYLGPNFAFMLHVGGGADPMNFTATSSLYAGLGIGGDLIRPKEKLIEALVKDAETGQPIEGARIKLSGDLIDTVFYSDSTGRFTLPELMEGDEINATKEGYHPEAVTAEEVGEALTLTIAMDPIKESFIAGIVADAETADPLRAVVSFHDIETGEVLPSISSDAVTGYFRTKIEPATYRMKTKAPGYYEDHTTLTIGIAENKMVDIFLTPEEKPKPVELKPVTVTGFGRGHSDIGFEQMVELEKVAELLKENPDATVVITGHTDSVGSDGVNLQIGRRRAESVAGYLLMRGIKVTRMQIATGGERYPVGDNRYRSGRRANRRVELVFSRKASEEISEGVLRPPTRK